METTEYAIIYINVHYISLINFKLIYFLFVNLFIYVFLHLLYLPFFFLFFSNQSREFNERNSLWPIVLYWIYNMQYNNILEKARILNKAKKKKKIIIRIIIINILKK